MHVDEEEKCKRIGCNHPYREHAHRAKLNKAKHPCLVGTTRLDGSLMGNTEARCSCSAFVP